MEKMTPKRIKEKVSNLKAERSTWESHWQEIADYMLPRKNQISTTTTPGEKKAIFVLDNTGMYSAELLAGQLHGMLTNPNGFWFELTTGNLAIDQLDDVRFWLQRTSRDMHNVMNNSNFQTEVHELYLDEVAFGTAAMYVEEDDKDYVRFSTKFIGEYYIGENSKGVVDELYRSWKWSARQLVEEFGIENVGKKVTTAYEKASDDKFECIHAVFPATMVAENGGPFDYISKYILPEEDHVLETKGYKEFPYVVPRWSKGTGEKYGRSPAMTALPEVKTVNKMMETVLRGAQKVVDPPVQMPDDGFVLPVITKPGGINYFRAGGNDKITPIFNDSRIDFGFEVLKDKRGRIREAFFIDQLMLQQGPQMTATEVLQRTEEKMRLLGPMLGRQQSEFLRPLIDRVFGIMLRRGLIDKNTIPQALRGRKVDVKYSSMIAKSQRVTDAQNVMRYIESLSPFIQLDPTVADNLNGDAASRAMADVFGPPQQIIRTLKEVQQLRDARAEAQQKALAAEQEKEEVDKMEQVTGMMGKMQGQE